MTYNFPANLYPEGTTYTSHNSLFVFLDDKEKLEEFMKYFYKRLLDADANGANHVMDNDSDKMSLLDFEYNFFVECLGDWCQYYSENKSVFAEYKRYENKINKNEDGSKTTVRLSADFRIEMSIKERVQFDYNYSGWMKVHPFKKHQRFNFVQVFLNGMLGKTTYVLNYSKRMYATPITQVLAKNIVTGEYKKMATISFHRSFLLDNLSQKKLDVLKKMGREFERIITTSKGVNARIKKLGIDEDSLRIYNKFFIVEMEKNRNIFDGKWQFFKDSE
jgi:hypothetical protein